MKGHAIRDRHSDFNNQPEGKTDQLYSAEFFIEGLNVCYQFRIWKSNSSSLALLVKEDSDILKRLKVGDMLSVKYYSENSGYPSESKATAIRHITREEQGPLRGHYLVGLEILEGLA